MKAMVLAVRTPRSRIHMDSRVMRKTSRLPTANTFLSTPADSRRPPKRFTSD
jgi:hypothetical protein